MQKKIKPKKCKVCALGFIPARPLQVVCSGSCAYKFVQKKEIEKRTKEMNKELNGLSIMESAARKIFQKWIRLRDESDGCISCKSKTALKYDAGHYFKAELFSGLIFEEINVNKQCAYCNGKLMHGNLIEYRKGMIIKYGEAIVQKLENESNSLRQVKFTREYLENIIFVYKEKIKINDFTSESEYLKNHL